MQEGISCALAAWGKTAERRWEDLSGKTRLANNNNNPAADTTSSSSVAASPATIELSFPDGPQQPLKPKQKTALPLSKFGAVAQAAFAAAASPDTTTPPAASAPQPPPPPPPHHHLHHLSRPRPAYESLQSSNLSR